MDNVKELAEKAKQTADDGLDQASKALKSTIALITSTSQDVKAQGCQLVKDGTVSSGASSGVQPERGGGG